MNNKHEHKVLALIATITSGLLTVNRLRMYVAQARRADSPALEDRARLAAAEEALRRVQASTRKTNRRDRRQRKAVSR